MSEETLARAIELDDGLPLDTCPGCGSDITGWRSFYSHWLPGHESADGSIWVGGLGGKGYASKSPVDGCCVWDIDYLWARAFRREYIKAHSGEH